MFPEGRALEFLIAAIVALVVVGPKDLPILMRRLGQFMGRMRAMAAEFRASFDEMARQSELDELRREVEAMRRGQFADPATQATKSDIEQTFADIHQTLTNPETPATPAMGLTSAEVADAPGGAPLAPASAGEAEPAPTPAEAAPPAPRRTRGRKASADGEGAAPAAKPPAEPLS